MNQIPLLGQEKRVKLISNFSDLDLNAIVKQTLQQNSSSTTTAQERKTEPKWQVKSMQIYTLLAFIYHQICSHFLFAVFIMQPHKRVSNFHSLICLHCYATNYCRSLLLLVLLFDCKSQRSAIYSTAQRFGIFLHLFGV